MTLAPIINVVSDEGGNPICDAIGLLKDMSNSRCDRKAKKVSHIMEDRIGIQMLYPISNPATTSDRITLKNNPPRSQVLPHIDNTCPSSIKLHFRDRWLKQMRTPCNQEPGIHTAYNKACTTLAISHIAIEVDLYKSR